MISKRVKMSIGIAVCLGLVFSVLACAFPISSSAEVTQNTMVSGNKRFLTTQDGEPFFYLADTAWELFHRSNKGDADTYLTNRATKGFNTIQAVLLAEMDGLNTANAYGYKPLTNNNPETPAVVAGADNDYWDHCDYIVNKADELGLYLALLPTWGDKVDLLWGVGPVVFTSEARAYSYGRFVGDRYKTQKNIIWTLGGDRGPNAEWVWNAMAEGIADGTNGVNSRDGYADYSTTTMTYHAMGGRSSSESFQNSAWLDFNSYQSGHGATNLNSIYSFAQSDYTKIPTKPVINTEPNYENHPINWNPSNGYFNDYDVRKSFYWSVFAGGAGYTYGCQSIWQMYAPGRSPVSSPKDYWYNELNLPGAAQAGIGKNLMLSRPYFSRVPDNSMIAGTGSGGDYITATRDSGGNYAFIYFPKETISKTIYTTNLAGGTINAWWYSPRDGKCYDQNGNQTTAPFSTFPKQNMTFDPPGANASLDWILVLDNAAMDYLTPGTGVAVNPTTKEGETTPTTTTTIGQNGFVKGINCNGGSVTIEGNAWQSYPSAINSGFSDGGASAGFDAEAWSPAPPDSEYQDMLNSVLYKGGADLKVSQSLSNGTYQVYLWAVENYTSNFRKYDVVMEGVTKAVGVGEMALGTWTKYGPYTVTITDGLLNIDLVRIKGDPLLCGLSIYATDRMTASTTTPTTPAPPQTTSTITTQSTTSVVTTTATPYTNPYLTGNGYLWGLDHRNNTVSGFTSSFGAQPSVSFMITDTGGKTITSARIGTGAMVKLSVNGSLTEQFTVILYGDTDGDGLITVIDLLKMKKHVLSLKSLTGSGLLAGNADRCPDGTVDVIDILATKKHLLKIKSIHQS